MLLHCDGRVMESDHRKDKQDETKKTFFWEENISNKKLQVYSYIHFA